MPDYEFIGKSQLSRGFSFPLKRSTLDAFLDHRQVRAVTGVAYCGPSDDRRVLCADYRYWGPQDSGVSHSLILWVNAVPSALRYYIANQIQEQVLPRLADWMQQFTDASKLASQLEHRFELYYDEVSDDGSCRLNVRVDTPRKQRRLPKYRAKVRP
jgi:hypothetical protein